MENRNFYNQILTEHNLHPEHKHDLADGYCRGLLRLFPQPATVFSNISETLPRPGIGSTTLTALLLAGAVVFALDLLQRRRRVDWA